MKDHIAEIQGYADDNQLKITFQPSQDKLEVATIELQLAIAETRKFFLTHQL